MDKTKENKRRFWIEKKWKDKTHLTFTLKINLKRKNKLAAYRFSESEYGEEDESWCTSEPLKFSIKSSSVIFHNERYHFVDFFYYNYH